MVKFSKAAIQYTACNTLQIRYVVTLHLQQHFEAIVVYSIIFFNLPSIMDLRSQITRNRIFRRPLRVILWLVACLLYRNSSQSKPFKFIAFFCIIVRQQAI